MDGHVNPAYSRLCRVLITAVEWMKGEPPLSGMTPAELLNRLESWGLVDPPLMRRVLDALHHERIEEYGHLAHAVRVHIEARQLRYVAFARRWTKQMEPPSLEAVRGRLRSSLDYLRGVHDASGSTAVKATIDELIQCLIEITELKEKPKEVTP